MLHALKPNVGSKKTRKRVARGAGQGGGTTGGRGTKGQQSRAGKGRRFGFEGGQTPLIRRQPKLGGFSNPNRKNFEAINIDTLEAKLDAGSYDIPALKRHNIVKTNKPVKLLGRGVVKKKFAISVHAVSKSAKQTLENAGGSVSLV